MRLLLLLILPLAASAETHVPDSMSRADVQAKVSIAVSGDTIACPAGTGYWDGSVKITNKTINIVGAPGWSSVIVDEASNRGDYLGFHVVALTNLTGSPLMINGFRFEGGTTNTGTSALGILTIQAASSNWIVCSNLFLSLHSRPGGLYGTGYGVWTRNTHLNPAGEAGFLISGTGQYGLEDWTNDVAQGTGAAGFYIEHNLFSNGVQRAVTDSFAGGKYVFRFNNCYKATPQTHEMGSGSRGPRWSEIIGNVLDDDGGASGSAIYIRAGSGIVASNAANGSGFNGQLAALVYYRAHEEFTPFLQADGTNNYDTNFTAQFATGTHAGADDAAILSVAGTPWVNDEWIGYTIINLTTSKKGIIIDNTANTITHYTPITSSFAPEWDTGNSFEIRRVYQALDQPGVGKGDYLSGGSSVVPHTNHAFAPAGAVHQPRQVADPIYFWGNSGDASAISVDPYRMIVPGLNYTNGTYKPGYTFFADPHPLVTAYLDTSVPFPRTSSHAPQRGRWR